MTRSSVESWTHHTSQELANYIDVVHPMPLHWEIGPLSQQLFWIAIDIRRPARLALQFVWAVIGYQFLLSNVRSTGLTSITLSSMRLVSHPNKGANIYWHGITKFWPPTRLTRLRKILSDQTIKIKTITLFLTDRQRFLQPPSRHFVPLLPMEFSTQFHCENWSSQALKLCQSKPLSNSHLMRSIHKTEII